MSEQDVAAEFHAQAVRSLPRNLTTEAQQAWIADPSGLRSALEGALSPKGISILQPTIQQIVFLVRLNYDEKVLAKAKRLENWDRIAGSPIYNEELDQHGKSGSPLAVARLVSIPQKFRYGAEAAAYLGTLGLRPGIATELADCALAGQLTEEKIGHKPVIALGDQNLELHSGSGEPHRHFGLYSESPDQIWREKKIWRRLCTYCDNTSCGSTFWYLAFKK